jgi:hypothetical protein
MSSGGMLDDNELFAFARPPASPSVTPVLAQYQRPSFNTAPAIDTANKFALAQAQIGEANQIKDFNAQANPLRLKALQTEVKNGLDQQSQNEQYQTLSKAQAADAAAQYVVGQPAGDEQTKAWNTAADTMVAHGIMTPEEAAKWKGVPPNEYSHYAEGLHQTRGILENYMVSAGGKGSAAQQTQAGIAAQRETERALKAGELDDSSGNPPTQQQQDDYFNKVYQRITKPGGESAYKPPAASAPAAPAEPPADPFGLGAWGNRHPDTMWAKNMPVWAGGASPAAAPGASPPASGGSKAAPPAPTPPANPGAGAAKAAASAGSIAGDKGGKGKSDPNASGGDGSSAAKAVAYAGDPNNEEDLNKWFAAIKPGQWMVNPGFDPSKPEGPGNVRVGQKKAGETVQEAEGG